MFLEFLSCGVAYGQLNCRMKGLHITILMSVSCLSIEKVQVGKDLLFKILLFK